MGSKLGRKIKTVDDLLVDDDITQILSNLVKDRANIAGIVAIKILRDGTRQIWSSLDCDCILAELARATYQHINNENMMTFHDPAEESE